MSPGRRDPARPRWRQRLAATSGVAEVYDNATGSARFELPRDRVGDLIVIGDTHTVLGSPRRTHDLSLLEEPLRSHGGVSEQTVPFVINRPLADSDAERLARADDLRNFDLFDYVLNGSADERPERCYSLRCARASSAALISSANMAAVRGQGGLFSSTYWQSAWLHCTK